MIASTTSGASFGAMLRIVRTPVTFNKRRKSGTNDLLTWRETSFNEKCADQSVDFRAVLARFENDGVASHDAEHRVSMLSHYLTEPTR